MDDLFSDGVGRGPPRRITRDATRGVDAQSRKELRDAEDAACNAGMRNLAAVLSRWPALVEAMIPVRKALLQSMANCATLSSSSDRGVHSSCAGDGSEGTQPLFEGGRKEAPGR